MLSAELKKTLENAVLTAIKPIKDTAIRKSAGLVVTKDEQDKRPFSIAKYIKGAFLGNWQSAEKEKTQFIDINKALTISTNTGGGFLVPDQYAGGIIEKLENKTVIRQIAGQVYNMDKGDTIKKPIQTGGATAYWVGDNASITDSEQTLGEVEWKLRKVVAMTYLPYELLEDASEAADSFVNKDLVKRISLAEDLAALTGVGGAEPLGMYNNPNINKTAISASPTYGHFSAAMYAIDARNGSYNYWIANPRTRETLRELKDGNGNNLMVNNAKLVAETNGNVSALVYYIYGIPVKWTNQVSITQGGGAASYVILGNFEEFSIAQKKEIRLEVSREFKFDSDRLTIKAVRRVDFNVEQANEFQILTGIAV